VLYFYLRNFLERWKTNCNTCRTKSSHGTPSVSRVNPRLFLSVISAKIEFWHHKCLFRFANG